MARKENPLQDDPFERWWATTPESKLELIDGQLIIGTLGGSRRVLWYFLNDYGPALALPMAPADLWWAALNRVFGPPSEIHSPEEWVEWAADFEYHKEPKSAGPHGSLAHRRAYELLQHGLNHFTGTSGLGRMLGHDFVVRLGENGLTPDLLFIDHPRLPNLHKYYLDGPPALVIEIALEGSVDQDRILKRRLYEEAGVPEYWLIEADKQQILFWQSGANGHYHPVTADPEGIYHSATAPGLALSIPHLWTMDQTNWNQPWLPFLPVPHGEMHPQPKRPRDPDELGWDSLPFAPRIGLQPVPIRFDEFISWCPEAKFEHYGGGMVISSQEGSRRVMGLLLMTLGLVDVVQWAHPREWVTFLHKEPYQAIVGQQTEAIMRQAKYQSHDLGRGQNYLYGEIPPLPDLSASGETLAECQQNLVERVSNWVLLKIARRQEVPRFE